jgi:hypothetical protein
MCMIVPKQLTARITADCLKLPGTVVERFGGSGYRAERLTRGDGLTIRYSRLIAFAFGLFHGAAFAGALADFGLPKIVLQSAILEWVGPSSPRIVGINSETVGRRFCRHDVDDRVYRLISAHT